MTTAMKELHVICRVKEERKRLKMLAEWLNYWTDELTARHDQPDTREEEAMPEVERKARRRADLATQIAFLLVDGGEEHGALRAENDGKTMVLTLIRPRRKTKHELFVGKTRNAEG